MNTNNITIETVPHMDELPEDVSVHRIRNGFPLLPIQTPTSGARVYLRRLRAAEMAAWEETGGDYLLSDYVARDLQIRNMIANAI